MESIPNGTDSMIAEESLVVNSIFVVFCRVCSLASVCVAAGLQANGLGFPSHPLQNQHGVPKRKEAVACALRLFIRSQ